MRTSGCLSLGCGGPLVLVAGAALAFAGSVPDYEPNKDPGFGGLVMVPLIVLRELARWAAWPVLGVGAALVAAGLALARRR